MPFLFTVAERCCLGTIVCRTVCCVSLQKWSVSILASANTRNSISSQIIIIIIYWSFAVAVHAFYGNAFHNMWKQQMLNWKKCTRCSIFCGTTTWPNFSRRSITNGPTQLPNWCLNSKVSLSAQGFFSLHNGIDGMNTSLNAFRIVSSFSDRKNIQRNIGSDWQSVYVNFWRSFVRIAESDTRCRRWIVQKFGMGNSSRWISTIDIATTTSARQSAHRIIRKSSRQIDRFRFVFGELNQPSTHSCTQQNLIFFFF